jgi:hypothetical protein
MGIIQDLTAQIITQALATANEFVAQADDAADRVFDLSEGRDISSGYLSFPPVITAVEPVVPAVDDSLLTYDAQLNNLVGLLSNQLAGYFATYYPLAADAFDPATNWLINTITNSGTGIPEAIESQLWQRERDRFIREGARVENNLVSGYSAKGYSLAQPCMIHDLNQARYEQSGKIGISSTTIATKQAEIKIDTIKFAITQAMDSRFKAMNAASDYIRGMMMAPDSAARLASINTDAKAKMIGATSDLYRARLSRDQLVIGAQTDQMQASVQHESTWLRSMQDKINGNVQAAAAAAQTYSAVGASAISSLNSVVSQNVGAFE